MLRTTRRWISAVPQSVSSTSPCCTLCCKSSHQIQNANPMPFDRSQISGASCGCSNAVLCQLLNFAFPTHTVNPLHCRLRQDMVRSTKSRDHRFKFRLVSLWQSTSIHIFAWGIVRSHHCSRKRVPARKTYRYCTRWRLFAYFVGVTPFGALNSIDEHVGIRSWKRQKIHLSRWETS